jgi:glycosyltransferase involved in cell wall biosynthesis
VHVAQIGYGFEEIADPDALLDRYSSLTGWSEALSAAGADRVTVVQRFRRNARLTRNGIDYIFCGVGGNPGARRWTAPGALHRALTGVQPDVVHVNGLNFPVETWLLRRALHPGIAIVVQDHASRVPRVRGASPAATLRQAVRRRCMRVPDGLLFSVAEQASEWRQAGFIEARQTVYHVMESSTVMRPMPRAAARQATGVDGEPSVLWVGRLNANKDPLTILLGFERSLARLPGATLTMIYGAADLLPAVRDRLRASPALDRRVRLVGRVAHHLMPAFYSAADLFVLGSHHEGSGYALIEACACGLPAVVTDIPTFRAITADGSIGALWNVGDASSCARALAETGQRDLSSLRPRVAEHFDRALSWPVLGRQAMEAYGDIVSKRRAARGGLAR